MLHFDKKFDAGFSPQKRLLDQGAFKTVFQAAKKVYSRSLTLHIRKNDLDFPRLGIIVAKRNIRQAVTRNLVKRIVRESFRLNQSRLRGFDVIIVVHHAFGLLPREEMRKVIDEQWKKNFFVT